MLICILPAPESLYKTGNTNHIVISLRKLYAKRQNIICVRIIYIICLFATYAMSKSLFKIECIRVYDHDAFVRGVMMGKCLDTHCSNKKKYEDEEENRVCFCMCLCFWFAYVQCEHNWICLLNAFAGAKPAYIFSTIRRMTAETI